MRDACVCVCVCVRERKCVCVCDCVCVCVIDVLCNSIHDLNNAESQISREMFFGKKKNYRISIQMISSNMIMTSSSLSQMFSLHRKSLFRKTVFLDCLHRNRYGSIPVFTYISKAC